MIKNQALADQIVGLKLAKLELRWQSEEESSAYAVSALNRAIDRLDSLILELETEVNQ